MKVVWCWRCQAEIPMLDEAEWATVMAAKSAGSAWLEEQTVDRERHAFGAGYWQHITEEEREERFRPLLEAHRRVTGFAETNPNAIWHHRLSLYGPPCRQCGKPLRTPEAKFCAACGSRGRAPNLVGGRRGRSAHRGARH